MKKLTILMMIACTAVFVKTGFAQTQVKIMDIGVIPVMKMDTPSSSDSIELMVSFKVNDAGQSQSAYLLFGTSQNNSDVFSAVAGFTAHDGKYFLQYVGIEQEIKNYTAQCTVKLSAAQLSAYHVLSLYVQDQNGQNTGSLYFNK